MAWGMLWEPKSTMDLDTSAGLGEVAIEQSNGCNRPVYPVVVYGSREASA